MTISAFDIFKVGIGPSSSHTVGPMRAARRFVLRLQDAGLLGRCTRVEVQLYGSLGSTGKGHGSDKAVLLGLQGHEPESVDVDAIAALLQAIRDSGELRLGGEPAVAFDEKRDLVFHQRKSLPFHPNVMECVAFDADGYELDRRADDLAAPQRQRHVVDLPARRVAARQADVVQLEHDVSEAVILRAGEIARRGADHLAHDPRHVHVAHDSREAAQSGHKRQSDPESRTTRINDKPSSLFLHIAARRWFDLPVAAIANSGARPYPLSGLLGEPRTPLRPPTPRNLARRVKPLISVRRHRTANPVTALLLRWRVDHTGNMPACP